MSSATIEHVVIGLLRKCYTRPICQVREQLQSTCLRALPRNVSTSTRVADTNLQPRRNCGNRSVTKEQGIRRRTFHSTTIRLKHHEQQVEHVAVIGGGITGLAAAHYLAREKPNTKITLIEGSDRLGGWLRSTAIDVEGGRVVFESGPRTLRAGATSSLATLELVSRLRIQSQVLTTERSSPAARSRFIYYPDRLVLMPGPGQGIYNMLWTIFTEPLFTGLMNALFNEYRQPPRPDDLEDESIGSFLERRLGGPDIGNNIASAVLHGIYGGDIYKLSARSLLQTPWLAEKSHESLSAYSMGLSRNLPLVPAKDLTFATELRPKIDEKLSESMQSASVFTFRDGIEVLVKALEEDLRSKPNVSIRLNDSIKKIEYDNQSDNIKIITGKNWPAKEFTTVISTLSASNLAKVSAAPLPSLASQKAVTVMTVNLFYDDQFLLDEPGFGYLIPRSVPFEQNPECALGVVFDSFSSVGQDTVQGTKLTVMFGGHWWDDFGPDGYPSEAQGLKMAKAIMKRHLKIEVEPAAWKVVLHKNCIPQYTVGHEQRMKSASTELVHSFKGRLRVAGASYGGVGVNDCIRSAWDLVKGIVEWSGPGAKTGLEDFGFEKRLVPLDRTSHARLSRREE